MLLKRREGPKFIATGIGVAKAIFELQIRKSLHAQRGRTQRAPNACSLAVRDVGQPASINLGVRQATVLDVDSTEKVSIAVRTHRVPLAAFCWSAVSRRAAGKEGIHIPNRQSLHMGRESKVQSNVYFVGTTTAWTGHRKRREIIRSHGLRFRAARAVERAPAAQPSHASPSPSSPHRDSQGRGAPTETSSSVLEKVVGWCNRHRHDRTDRAIAGCKSAHARRETCGPIPTRPANTGMCAGLFGLRPKRHLRGSSQ